MHQVCRRTSVSNALPFADQPTHPKTQGRGSTAVDATFAVEDGAIFNLTARFRYERKIPLWMAIAPEAASRRSATSEQIARDGAALRASDRRRRSNFLPDKIRNGNYAAK